MFIKKLSIFAICALSTLNASSVSVNADQIQVYIVAFQDGSRHYVSGYDCAIWSAQQFAGTIIGTAWVPESHALACPDGL